MTRPRRAASLPFRRQPTAPAGSEQAGPVLDQLAGPLLAGFPDDERLREPSVDKLQYAVGPGGNLVSTGIRARPAQKNITLRERNFI